ncbi:UNVERIFIED_CONTAM: hypothetical protein Sradi_1975100 [Sesamum radiatum]|uniref:Bet v I/Major latex protein domain-containing protein n=1 Tax=Sesamum radiatum TaxID=300843 RepID=A0AAW2TFI4_SESRA
MVQGRVWEEMEVKVPASEAWKLYGSLLLAKVVVEALPDRFSKVEGTAGPASYKEKYTVVDDERRVKEAELVRAVFGSGVYAYRVRGEVIEKEGKTEECVVRGTIEYELKEEAAANAALVSIEPLRALMQAAGDYLTKNYNTNV